jgi:hypothetical protein
VAFNAHLLIINQQTHKKGTTFLATIKQIPTPSSKKIMRFLLLNLLLVPYFGAAVLQLHYDASVFITNANAPASYSNIVDSPAMVEGIKQAYVSMDLESPTSIPSFASGGVRNLRGVQEEVDRELYFYSCYVYCSGTSYLCRAYCPGWGRRLMEVALPDGDISDDDRQLLIAQTASSLKSTLGNECKKSLKVMAADPTLSAAAVTALLGATCNVTIDF